MKLRNIKKAVNEIANILAQNSIICRLLINDETTALTDATPAKTLNDLIEDHYISFAPPVESRIKDYGRNTFITILLENAIFHSADDNSLNTIVLYVSTNEDHLLLENNKNRLLEMCDCIIDALNGAKISSAGELNVNNMNHTMLSEFHSAYRISITFTDQQSQEVEI